MVRTDGVRAPAFNFVEWIGSLIATIGLVWVLLSLIGLAPLEFGLLALAAGLMLGAYIGENGITATPLGSLGLLISIVLVFGGTATLITVAGNSYGLFSIEMASRAEAMENVWWGAGMLVVGFVLTAIGDYLKV